MRNVLRRRSSDAFSLISERKGQAAWCRSRQLNVGKMNTEAAAARDAEPKPILETMWEMPYREIAQELTDCKIPAPHGGARNAMSVMRAMKRLGIAAK